MSRYRLFDREQIELKSLAERGHDLAAADCLPLDAPAEPYPNPEFSAVVDRIVQARRNGRPVVLMMGGHPIKLGLSRFLIDLIERHLITHLATNGAGIIHDFELSLGEGTSEDVPKWIKRGQFGLWNETGALNDIIAEAASRGEGLGEAVGRTIEESEFPRRDLSLAAAGWRSGVAVTSHVSIGSDIIHAHANCDGAALGQASYTDFLIFARAIQQLEGGVFLNVGSAVTGPEVYLKALSMARNVARQSNQRICDFTTAVFDLVQLPPNYREGPPTKDHHQYYYRPWKTILVRTVADGGQSFYFGADHRVTIPNLWRMTVARMSGETSFLSAVA
ncbi:MAG TPA: hypothetical protein VMM76_09005 [Pirellulaceae bacterium]|nr:hypothetical protein [Pirellulaceae bacterium]